MCYASGNHERIFRCGMTWWRGVPVSLLRMDDGVIVSRGVARQRSLAISVSHCEAKNAAVRRKRIHL
jgi:hypothetical protein